MCFIKSVRRHRASGHGVQLLLSIIDALQQGHVIGQTICFKVSDVLIPILFDVQVAGNEANLAFVGIVENVRLMISQFKGFILSQQQLRQISSGFRNITEVLGCTLTDAPVAIERIAILYITVKQVVVHTGGLVAPVIILNLRPQVDALVGLHQDGFPVVEAADIAFLGQRIV